MEAAIDLLTDLVLSSLSYVSLYCIFAVYSHTPMIHSHD